MATNLNLRKPLVIFDLETTGLSLSQDRIIEYCFIKLSPDGSTQTLKGRCNPEKKIPIEISRIHGIYDADVADCPRFNEIAKNLSQFLEGCDLAGFNILKFDLPMLVEEFLRVHIDFSTKNRNLVDAQKIFHLMEPRNLAAALRFYCHKELQGAHSAEADTKAVLEILEAQVSKYDGLSIGEDSKKFAFTNDMAVLNQLSITNQIDLAGRFVYNEKGEPVINFGKHKDKTIEWVLKQEPSYYDWFQKSDFPLESKRKFTELKLKMAIM